MRAKLQNWRGVCGSTNETLARRQPLKPASGTHSGGELADGMEDYCTGDRRINVVHNKNSALRLNEKPKSWSMGQCDPNGDQAHIDRPNARKSCMQVPLVKFTSINKQDVVGRNCWSTQIKPTDARRMQGIMATTTFAISVLDFLRRVAEIG